MPVPPEREAVLAIATARMEICAELAAAATTSMAEHISNFYPTGDNTFALADPMALQSSCIAGGIESK